MLLAVLDSRRLTADIDLLAVNMPRAEQWIASKVRKVLAIEDLSHGVNFDAELSPITQTRPPAIG
jgi:uncharacterized protein YccT (UPF0319 family)